ncbi:helix-turn-helix domain-containing protein [Salinibacterium sp. ZJ454]|uniref:helix-turn-helix domain-containing protein n=1 Tax=Salinibacterium sp. ZJ454 TaxID=2708339 RepID=UPI00141D773C|nr:helix-turn-helix domain-containing protein [Salinibacterium sp. ZJ454]
MADDKMSVEVRKAFERLMDVAQAQGKADLVATLLREAADALQKQRPRGRGLSEEQARYLIESGDFTPDELAETEREVAEGVLAREELNTRLGALAASLSTAEVAQRLGIDASRVRHRRAKGTLYAFMVGGKRRYPTWQFTDDPKQPVLPGLAALVEAFPKDWHPASIQGFMSTPKANLLVDGERMSPVEWLRHAGDPEALVDILDSFLQS